MHLKKVPGTGSRAWESNVKLPMMLDPEDMGWAAMTTQWPARPQENRGKKGGWEEGDNHAVSLSLIILSGSWGSFYFLH